MVKFSQPDKYETDLMGNESEEEGDFERSL